MTVAFLVYVFLARIRFPRNESITSIVRERYSGEKGGYKLRKAKLDINFLIKGTLMQIRKSRYMFVFI